MRRITYAGVEHQAREIHALHMHADGHLTTCYGNGREVMKVIRARKPWVEVIGEDGLNEFGTAFRYEDYFLPEELHMTATASRITTHGNNCDCPQVPSCTWTYCHGHWSPRITASLKGISKAMDSALRHHESLREQLRDFLAGATATEALILLPLIERAERAASLLKNADRRRASRTGRVRERIGSQRRQHKRAGRSR
jgi:hypothetical protein